MYTIILTQLNCLRLSEEMQETHHTAVKFLILIPDLKPHFPRAHLYKTKATVDQIFLCITEVHKYEPHHFQKVLQIKTLANSHRCNVTVLTPEVISTVLLRFGVMTGLMISTCSQIFVICIYLPPAVFGFC